MAVGIEAIVMNEWDILFSLVKLIMTWGYDEIDDQFRHVGNLA